MIRADDYWDSDRATYEDELNAWRDRTATPIAAVVAELPPLSARRATLPARHLARLAPVERKRRSAARRGTPERQPSSIHAQAARRDRVETRRIGVGPPLAF